MQTEVKQPPRRERLEHGIFRRRTQAGESRYECSYRDSCGRQRWGTRSSLKAARLARAELVSRVARGERVTPSNASFGDYADAWLRRQQTRLRPSTYACYEVYLRLQLKPRFGPRRLQAISVDDVAALIGEPQEGKRYRDHEGRARHARVRARQARRPGASADGGRVRSTAALSRTNAQAARASCRGPTRSAEGVHRLLRAFSTARAGDQRPHALVARRSEQLIEKRRRSRRPRSRNLDRSGTSPTRHPSLIDASYTGFVVDAGRALATRGCAPLHRVVKPLKLDTACISSLAGPASYMELRRRQPPLRRCTGCSSQPIARSTPERRFALAWPCRPLAL